MEADPSSKMKIDPTKYLVDADEVETFEKFGSTKTFDDGTKRKSNSRAKKQKSHRKEKIKWQLNSQT